MCGELQTAVLHALMGGDCRTIPELTDELGMSAKQVSKAVHRLIARGAAERAEAGCYRITAAGRAVCAAGEPLKSGPCGPLQGLRRPKRATLRDKLWRAIRIRKSFGVSDLLRLAQTGDEAAAQSNARRYLRALARAGYLAPLKRRPTGPLTSNGEKRFALIRDSGPISPVVRPSKRTVYDPNTSAEYPIDRDEEDQS